MLPAIVPTCDKCGSELIQDDPTEPNILVCMYCDLPQEDMEYFYESICWSCGSEIDSRKCVQSKNPGMGYHCNLCGKDLTEWKRKFQIV